MIQAKKGFRQQPNDNCILWHETSLSLEVLRRSSSVRRKSNNEGLITQNNSVIHCVIHYFFIWIAQPFPNECVEAHTKNFQFSLSICHPVCRAMKKKKSIDLCKKRKSLTKLKLCHYADAFFALEPDEREREIIVGIGKVSSGRRPMKLFFLSSTTSTVRIVRWKLLQRQQLIFTIKTDFNLVKVNFNTILCAGCTVFC